MKCYCHLEEEAVGTCKSCGKGLCPACAVDLGKGLACRGWSEAEVTALIGLIEHNLLMVPKTSGILSRNRQVQVGSAIFSIAAGLAFCCGEASWVAHWTSW
jgi:hypothetical protein